MNPEQQIPLPVNPDKIRVDDSLTVTEPGETTVCDITRHPAGIITIYVISGVVLLVIALMTFALGPHLGSADGSNTFTKVGSIILLVLVLIFAVYGYIATRVYWGNRWIVTTDSITQIDQTSLFKRQSSQLSLGNLEDVTAEQNGLLAHMFNFGLLKVETAGERSKFSFPFCPNPNYYAKQILAAREAFEQGLKDKEEYPQADTNTNDAPPISNGAGLGEY